MSKRCLLLALPILALCLSLPARQQDPAFRVRQRPVGGEVPFALGVERGQAVVQPPPPSSPAAAVLAASRDALALPASEAYWQRYLWVSSKAQHREEFLHALALHVNLLSDRGKIQPMRTVAHDVIALDVRDYGWDRKLEVWERLGPLDPFFHVKAKIVEKSSLGRYWPGGKDGERHFHKAKYALDYEPGETAVVASPWLPAKPIDALRELAYSESPILAAEWFLVQSARQVSIRNKQEGVGYYDWLGLKKRDDFFALTGTDEKVAERIYREWRAVVDRSGISQQSRQILALGAVSGRVWGTLDAFSQVDRGQPKRNLRKGEFQHDAEEWYGFLPNGLFVTFLSDKGGVAQESAPDKIGPDDSALRVGRDARVHANLSCIRCHGVDRDWLKPVDDWARRSFRAGGRLRLQDPDKDVLLSLESQYLRNLDALLEDDRRNYVRAVSIATASAIRPGGLTSKEAANAYGRTWNRYVEDAVTLDDAARELGCTPESFRAALAREAAVRGGLDLILASYLDSPQRGLTRLEWEDCYSLAQTLVAGIHPVEERIQRRK